MQKSSITKSAYHCESELCIWGFYRKWTKLLFLKILEKYSFTSDLIFSLQHFIVYHLVISSYVIIQDLCLATMQSRPENAKHLGMFVHNVVNISGLKISSKLV